MKVVKVKKEVWIERCDFCEEEKKHICSICGTDVCGKHALTLDTSYYKQSYSGMFFPPSINVARNFCPNHLSDELRKLLDKAVQSCKESVKDE